LTTPLARITKAAVRSFREQGIEKTSIADVARIARVSRPNIYRYVSNMEDLVRLVVLERADHILHELKVADGPWYEALIDLFVQQVSIALRDEVFMLIVEQASPVAAKLLAGDNAVSTSLNAVIAPIVAKGRAAGEIREGLTDDEILYWLHYQTWSLCRDPRIHKTVEIEGLARKFVVGGLLASGEIPKRPRAVRSLTVRRTR
jgi:AcrR family transcriptional regulator